MKRLMTNVISLAVLSVTPMVLPAGSWPQFRGPGGKAVPDVDQKLPAEIGPEQAVLWKIELPPGHSSPVVIGDRIFLTTVKQKRLYTVAIDRTNGKILWEAEAPINRLEKIHQIGSLAQPTPATDGTRVVSFFGSSGMHCYDMDGKLYWHFALGPFKSDFGAASSPLIVDDLVILSQDHDRDSFLMAINKKTGKEVWKTDRSEFPVSCATPVIWEVDGHKQIVVSGTLRTIGYNLETGKEIWTVHGMARVCNMTPAIGDDNTLFVAGWAALADEGERVKVPTFKEMIEAYDKNKNGTLELDEMPAGPFKERFSLIDRDKDGHITQAEWDGMKKIFEIAENRMIALRPGGKGDVTETHVLWSQSKYLPFVPSPLYYKGRLYLMKNNGILTTLDAKTGTMTKSGRLQASGNYYASPVFGDGKVYICSQKGEVIVVSTEAEWKVLHKADFNEEIYSTPAIVDGRIYLRTTGHLYCFGSK